MPLSNQQTSFNYKVSEPRSNVQKFTSSGTWIKPRGVTFVQVCLWGGGGGGGDIFLAGTDGTSGTGGNGIIVVTYTPSTAGRQFTARFDNLGL